MEFGKFLIILYNNSANNHSSNKSEYVLEIFSALCGEENPLNNEYKLPSNSDNSAEYNLKGSSKMPNSLRNGDPSYRNRLYLKKELTNSIKTHIRKNANENTFITYLDKVITFEYFPKLCNDFNIYNILDKSIVYKAIYKYFLKFAQKEIVEESISDIVHKLLKDETKIAASNVTSNLLEEDVFDKNKPINVDSLQASDAYNNYDIRLDEILEFNPEYIGECIKDKNPSHELIELFSEFINLIDKRPSPDKYNNTEPYPQTAINLNKYKTELYFYTKKIRCIKNKLQTKLKDEYKYEDLFSVEEEKWLPPLIT